MANSTVASIFEAFFTGIGGGIAAGLLFAIFITIGLIIAIIGIIIAIIVVVLKKNFRLGFVILALFIYSIYAAFALDNIAYIIMLFIGLVFYGIYSVIKFFYKKIRKK